MSAAADLANLRTRRAAVAAELAALSTSAAGGLPNTDGPGVNVDHVGYKDGLYRELESLDRAIKAIEDIAAEEDGNLGMIESQEWC